MTIEEIKKRFKEVHVADTFGTKKEIKELPMILKDDETIMYATSGLFKNNTWLIVVTDQRVLFLDKGMVFGLKQVEIPLDKVNSVSFKTGLLLGKVTIYHGSSEMGIDQITKSTVKPLVDAINREAEKYKNKNSAAETKTVSAADELLKYKQLLDAGVLTQEEFDAKKKQLLGLQ
ncbi:MAG: PH domain-containing protein [Sporolactobacillus sp.]